VAHVEEWRDIERCPGYQISSHGRVRSFASNRHGFCDTPHFLGTDVNSNGYKRVILGSNGRFFIHHLVAKEFIPNPNGHPVVRHKDDDQLNNYANNLEWGTQSDNIQDAIRRGRFVSNIAIAKEAALKKQRKKIVAKDLDGHRIAEYQSLCDAARDLGLNVGNVSNVLHGRQKKTGQYTFEYADEGVTEHV
jgi:hypothetical protein